jgi:acyl-CoA synthetase (AMP-forming)/AMP-acid ligase II
MDTFGYTSLAGVPFVYEMLDRIGFTKKSYKSLRYLTQAGGKLKTELAIKFGEYAQLSSIDFFIMYGATEATARMSYLPPELLLLKPDSIGKPIPNGFFQIDPSTSELLYKGANIFGGYVDKPEDLSNYEAPDWLKTGDIASKDEDGCYYIKGRLKRFVKIFGNRINLDEIESILYSSLSVQVKCIGVEDKWLAIFYIGTVKNESEVINYLHKVMQLHPSILKFISLPEFPYMINGKVNYQELQNKLS